MKFNSFIKNNLAIVQVRNKTIIGLKSTEEEETEDSEGVRNKTIIGLKLLNTLICGAGKLSLEIRL